MLYRFIGNEKQIFCYSDGNKRLLAKSNKYKSVSLPLYDSAHSRSNNSHSDEVFIAARNANKRVGWNTKREQHVPGRGLGRIEL